MTERDLWDLLRRSATAQIEKASPVLTPKVLAEALASAKEIYARDRRKGALIQLQCVSAFARSHAELSPVELAPIYDIQEALVWAERGKSHPLFGADVPSGAPRVFNSDVLDACLAVWFLHKAGRTIKKACAEVAPHWGKTTKQMLDARREFVVRHKTGTPQMREMYRSRTKIECTAEEAEQWATACISSLKMHWYPPSRQKGE